MMVEPCFTNSSRVVDDAAAAAAGVELTSSSVRTEDGGDSDCCDNAGRRLHDPTLPLRAVGATRGACGLTTIASTCLALVPLNERERWTAVVVEAATRFRDDDGRLLLALLLLLGAAGVTTSAAAVFGPRLLVMSVMSRCLLPGVGMQVRHSVRWDDELVRTAGVDPTNAGTMASALLLVLCEPVSGTNG